MIYNKKNFSIANFCGKNQARPELAGIFVEADKTTSTDGFILIQVSTPKGDIADFPTLPSGQKPKSNFQPFILPAGKAKEIESNIPAKMSLPILNHAVIISQKAGIVEIATTDLEGAKITQTRTIEGKYPEFQPFLKEKGKYIEVLLNPAYLEKIANFFKGFSESQTITMKVPYDDKSPLHFISENPDQSAHAVLMPCQK